NVWLWSPCDRRPQPHVRGQGGGGSGPKFGAEPVGGQGQDAFADLGGLGGLQGAVRRPHAQGERQRLAPLAESLGGIGVEQASLLQELTTGFADGGQQFGRRHLGGHH